MAENNKAEIEEQIETKKGGGIGLVNVKKRLDIIYGDNFDLEIKNKVDTFFVSLKIKK